MPFINLEQDTNFTDINYDDKNITFQTILKHHTIGNQQHFYKYKNQKDALQDISTQLKNINYTDIATIQYTLIGTGKEYLDFICIILDKPKIFFIKLVDIESCEYYLEKIIQLQMLNTSTITTIPNGLIINLNDIILKSSCNHYANKFPEFQETLKKFVFTAKQIQEQEIYKFEIESLLQSILRLIFIIKNSNIDILQKFLETKLNFPNSINLKNKIKNENIEESYNIKNYSYYFYEEDLKKIKKWYLQNFQTLENYYQQNKKQFIKRNISHNNTFILENNIMLIDYSKVKIGCILIDLADYISICRISSNHITIIDFQNTTTEYEFTFDMFDNNDEQDINENIKTSNESNISKINQTKDIQHCELTNIKELNKLIVLTTLKNAALLAQSQTLTSTCLHNTKIQKAQTLTQLRDMIDTQYNQQIPEIQVILQTLTLDKYINIIIKQCKLHLESSDETCW